MSRTALLVIVALVGCHNNGGNDDTGAPLDTTDTDAVDTTDTDADADTDADTDSDTDADADTDSDADTDTSCPPVTSATTTAIVADIDATLTTSDNEWLLQIAGLNDHPAMRPDANTLMSAWHDRGYRIFYVTARGDSIPFTDTRALTEGWLAENSFPYESADVYLYPGIYGFGTDTPDYKTGVLQNLIAAGFDIQYAYGNAETDITAYTAAGIPLDHQFLVGTLAGTLGAVGVPDDQAYTAHLALWPSSAPCGH